MRNFNAEDELHIQKRSFAQQSIIAKMNSKGVDTFDRKLDTLEVRFSNMFLSASGQQIVLFICLGTSVLYLIHNFTKIMLCVCRRLNVPAPDPWGHFAGPPLVQG